MSDKYGVIGIKPSIILKLEVSERAIFVKFWSYARERLEILHDRATYDSFTIAFCQATKRRLYVSKSSRRICSTINSKYMHSV